MAPEAKSFEPSKGPVRALSKLQANIGIDALTHRIPANA